MALSISGDQVESVLLKLLPDKGYEILISRRKNGETGADIIVQKGNKRISIECIGFQDVPPLRSKQFYEAFFRAISRLKDKSKQCIMALPMRFKNGMNARAKQYGVAWNRIGKAFPELEVWLVDVQEEKYEVHKWNDWPTSD